MPGRRNRAPHWGAFFVVGWLLLAVPPLWARDCPSQRIDERATLAKVIDGDTLRLADGRLVRFIGINSPELGRDGRADEPQAVEAREALRALSGGRGARVGLRYDADRRDRHGRLLAHVYTADGRSASAALLTQGLAAQIVVPPNLWGLDCYRAAEAEARAAGRGVWRSIYRPIPVDDLSRQTRGFRLVRGRITDVADSRYSVWLNFPHLPGEGPRRGVALRVPRKDLANFPPGFLPGLVGREVVARGWLFGHKGQLVMALRHPAMLQTAPALRLTAVHGKFTERD